MKCNINLTERMEHYHVPGLSMAFIEQGQIRDAICHGVLEAGTDRKVSRDSMFSACSISKFLTAMLALTLTEQGVLYLDEDINKSLVSWKIPEHVLTKNKKVTLRNLLCHQSGIQDPENSFPELNSMAGIPTTVDLLAGITPYCKEPVGVTYEPESEFHYSDAGYSIIQQVIEDVMGQPFQQVMNELIFKPLNMKNSLLDMSLPDTNRADLSCGHNQKGEVVDGKYPVYPYPAGSGLWTTPADLAQALLEIMNALKGESKIGLSPGMAKDMISPQTGKNWAGLGVFLDYSANELEMTSLGWGVGFQCMLVAYPYQEKGAVIMTNAELGVHQMEGIIGDIYKSLMS